MRTWGGQDLRSAASCGLWPPGVLPRRGALVRHRGRQGSLRDAANTCTGLLDKQGVAGGQGKGYLLPRHDKSITPHDTTTLKMRKRVAPFAKPRAEQGWWNCMKHEAPGLDFALKVQNYACMY